MKQAIAIVPNENILDVEPFYKDLSEGDRHGKGIRRFSEIYNLGITPESLGLEEEEYPGYIYQIALISLGHFVLCFDEEVWVFIPSKLSNGHNKNKSFFRKYKKSLYFVIGNNEKEIVKTGDCKKVNCYREMYDYVNDVENFYESEELKR